MYRLMCPDTVDYAVATAIEEKRETEDRLLTALQLAAMAFGGSPGRATGGPVTPGRAYRVGENGPEWFVPTSSGRVEANGGQGGGGYGSARDIRITVNVHGGVNQGGPERMQATGRQIARAVRAAIEDAR